MDQTRRGVSAAWRGVTHPLSITFGVPTLLVLGVIVVRMAYGLSPVPKSEPPPPRTAAEQKAAEEEFQQQMLFISTMAPVEVDPD